MKYVVCNPEDLLDAPNGKMAPVGTEVFGSVDEALKRLETKDYWAQEVFPCDAGDEHCMDSGKEWNFGVITQKNILLLAEARHVSESKRIRAWVTLTTNDKSTNESIAVLAYALSAAGITFMVTHFSDGHNIRCLHKDGQAVAAIVALSRGVKIEMPPMLEVVIKTQTIDSTLDLI